jgi:hypothetical protein
MKKRNSEESAAQSAIVLAAAVIVVAVLAVLFGLQTLISINTKRLAAVDPWLNDVPQPLQESGSPAAAPAPVAVSAKGGRAAKPAGPPELRGYDYEFVQPWPGTVKTTPALTFMQYQFPDGQVIDLLDPGAEIDLMRQMKNGENALYNQFTNVFGDQAPDSNYDLYRVVYSAAPSQISPFTNRQDAFRTNVLINWKLSFGFDSQPGIQLVQGGKNRGFEFGKPGGDKPVALRLFDATDKQARFIFTVLEGSTGVITQENVDTVVNSFQLIPVMER